MKAQEKIRELEQEVEQLRRDRANLEIHNRILRADGYIAFECDGIKCGTNHKCDGCYRTTDINHAKNFYKNGDRYFEKMKLNDTDICWEVIHAPTAEPKQAESGSSDVIYRKDAIETVRKYNSRFANAKARGEVLANFPALIAKSIEEIPTADVVSIYSYAEELSENDALRNKIEQLTDGTVPREEYDNLKEAFDLLYAYEHSEKEASEWIPCSERLPDDKHEVCLVNVILKDSPNKIVISKFVAYDYERGWIDAWMPLPQPYKGGDDE